MSAEISQMRNLQKRLAVLGILGMMFCLGGEVIQHRCSEIYAGFGALFWTVRSIIGDGTDYALNNFDRQMIKTAVRDVIRVIVDISQAIFAAIIVLMAIFFVCYFFGMKGNRAQ